MAATRDFKYGTTGPDVKQFQQNLLTLGYQLPKYGADGAYGAETDSAARSCAHDHHWDHCWTDCPMWLQDQVAEAASEIPVPNIWLPTGRGMFIQSMNALPELVDTTKIVQHVGLKYLIIQAHWQYSDSSKKSTVYNWPDNFASLTQSYGCTARAKGIIEGLIALGVQVIPFSYPVPTKSPNEVVDVLGKYAAAWKSQTVLIDPEAEWKSSSGAYTDEALTLSSKMAAAFTSWGMTSYGAPWYHRSFPFSSFKSAAYGIPQTYGVTSFGTKESYQRAWDEWAGYGFKYLVGAYGTYEKTDSELRQLLNVVASMNPPATIGWKWETTSDPEWEHIVNYLPK